MNPIESSVAAASLTNDDASATQSIKGSALEQALAHLLRGLRADGSGETSGSTHGAQSTRDRASEIQWGTLLSWAEAAGLILAQDFSGPERPGGIEHDVRFDSVSSRWWKYTNPGFSGSYVDWDGHSKPVMRMASPVEYLERLQLQNELFDDEIQLKGLWLDKAGGGWRIVTTQPDVPASAPTPDEIDSAMTSWGFELLPWPDVGRKGSMAYRMSDIAVWDAHPVNAGITPGGLVVPYDFIITRLP